MSLELLVSFCCILWRAICCTVLHTMQILSLNTTFTKLQHSSAVDISKLWITPRTYFVIKSFTIFNSFDLEFMPEVQSCMPNRPYLETKLILYRLLANQKEDYILSNLSNYSRIECMDNPEPCCSRIALCSFRFILVTSFFLRFRLVGCVIFCTMFSVCKARQARQKW